VIKLCKAKILMPDEVLRSSPSQLDFLAKTYNVPGGTKPVVEPWNAVLSQPDPDNAYCVSRITWSWYVVTEIPEGQDLRSRMSYAKAWDRTRLTTEGRIQLIGYGYLENSEDAEGLALDLLAAAKASREWNHD